MPTRTGSVRDVNAVPNPRESRGEIVDLSTREVWQDFCPTPRSWWDGLALEPPLMKAGYGSGNMDRMWFRRSPGADEDGPVRKRDIAGREFFFCARPLGVMPQESPRRLMVDDSFGEPPWSQIEAERLPDHFGIANTRNGGKAGCLALPVNEMALGDCLIHAWRHGRSITAPLVQGCQQSTQERAIVAWIGQRLTVPLRAGPARRTMLGPAEREYADIRWDLGVTLAKWIGVNERAAPRPILGG